LILRRQIQRKHACNRIAATSPLQPESAPSLIQLSPRKNNKMKKILFLNFIALVPFLMNAQDLALNKNVTLPGAATASITNATDAAGNPVKASKVARREARESKQFNKASKLFIKDFANASNVTWNKGANEFTATFTKDGMNHIAYYGKSGGLRSSMVSYGPEKLPADAQRVIRDTYDNYKITWVNEVHQNDITVYVVHLENDREIKLVTVCNGDTNIYQQYQKQ
jgi:hypothetical protein